MKNNNVVVAEIKVSMKCAKKKLCISMLKLIYILLMSEITLSPVIEIVILVMSVCLVMWEIFMQDAWVTRRFAIHEAGNCRGIKSEISVCLSLPAASFILNIYIRRERNTSATHTALITRNSSSHIFPKIMNFIHRRKRNLISRPVLSILVPETMGDIHNIKFDSLICNERSMRE